MMNQKIGAKPAPHPSSPIPASTYTFAPKKLPIPSNDFYGSNDSTPPKRTKFNNISSLSNCSSSVNVTFSDKVDALKNKIGFDKTSKAFEKEDGNHLSNSETTTVEKENGHEESIRKSASTIASNAGSSTDPIRCDSPSPPVHQESIDRDSPLPLKNLAFEDSMAEMKKLVAFENNHHSATSSFDSFNKDSSTNTQEETSTKRCTSKDVRYRIADAFQKLYNSYVGKRLSFAAGNDDSEKNETETQENVNASTNNITQVVESKAPAGHNSQENGPMLPFGPPNKSEAEDKDKEADQNTLVQDGDDTHFSSNHNEATNSTPIALLSSINNSSNEQSQIESRLEDLKSAVGERSSQFNSTHQQDASEFFYHVIDSVQEFYQSLNCDNEDPVTKTFELELDYLLSCPKCHHRTFLNPEKIRTLPLTLPNLNQSNEKLEEKSEPSTVDTPPLDLNLDSPPSSHSDDQPKNTPSQDKDNNSDQTSTSPDKKMEQDDAVKTASQSEPIQQQQKQYTLEDALNNYFKDDSLEYKCSQPGCDSAHRTKKCLIRKLPQVLFITLARYSYTGRKNLDKIEAPFKLSVPFKENKSPSHSPSVHCDITDDNNSYQLVAVVCHLGSSLNAGHYTSYVYNQNNDSWYSCDDDSISKVTPAEVHEDASKNGYCFFYAHQSKADTKLITSSAMMTPLSSPVSIARDHENCNDDCQFNSVEDW